MTGPCFLLVDGLDEISDEGARGAFVQQLNTFLDLHPGVSMVVTSREAGFRLVASTVARSCASYRLAEFDDEDITRLTVAWHREVVGDRPQVLKEAQHLAESICQTDRVLRLARNPLLLTTLLLVRRWVGELPQRRTVLYQKAIEVLLMSWNAAAHEKLEPSEALPQLGFLAFRMMKEGVQQISERRLRNDLVEARQQMEDIYAYARIGVDDFIRRVEHRSSLLVQSGHTFEEGRLWCYRARWMREKRARMSALGDGEGSSGQGKPITETGKARQVG
jgi:predicted NACHT family NTPase